MNKRFLPKNCYAERNENAHVCHVMIHFCSDVENHPEDPYNLDYICENFVRHGVGPHYIIDRSGQVTQLVEEGLKAYHAGHGSWCGLCDNMNDFSIGIELMAMGTAEEMALFMPEEAYAKLPKEWIGYTEAQYSSLRKLLSEIQGRHPEIKYDRTHILGHDDYAPGRKTDPGQLFDWAKIGL